MGVPPMRNTGKMPVPHLQTRGLQETRRDQADVAWASRP